MKNNQIEKCEVCKKWFSGKEKSSYFWFYQYVSGWKTKIISYVCSLECKNKMNEKKEPK